MSAITHATPRSTQNPLPSQGASGTASASTRVVDFLWIAKMDNAKVITSILATLFFGKKNEVRPYFKSLLVDLSSSLFVLSRSSHP